MSLSESQLQSLDRAVEEIDRYTRMAPDEYGIARNWAKSIGQTLAGIPLVERCFVTGSIARGTALREASDLDISAVLRDRVLQSAPKDVLGSLAQAFDNVNILQGSRIVTLKYGDGFAADILPVVYSRSELLTPNGSGDSWEANPMREIDELVHSTFLSHGGDLLRLIRVLKVWNRSKGAGLPSVGIEIAACMSHSDGPSIRPYLYSVSRTVGFLIGWLDGTAPMPPSYMDDRSTFNLGCQVEWTKSRLASLRLATKSIESARVADESSESGMLEDWVSALT